MVPYKIKLKNFCAIPAVEIDLTGISLCSIVGKNGASKSTLFAYAPLFALFGKPRPGTSLDDMVRTGTQDMSVTFDFEHNGEIYQVIRTRKLGKKTTCEFMKQTLNGWQSLSGTTVKETDAKIEELLSLDANTFLASSMILQGDANRFTKSLPSERKQILASILGLDVYSSLQLAAKEKTKALEVKLEGSKQELVNLSNKLETLPDIDTELQQVKQSIAITTLDIRQKETELADLQAQIKDLEAKQLQAQQIQQQITTIEDEISTRQTEYINLHNRTVDAEGLLKTEPDLLAKQQKLNEIRQQITTLEVKTSRIKELQVEVNRLEAEAEKLQNEANSSIAKIGMLQRDLSKKAELQQASEQYQQSFKELKQQDEIAEKWQEIQNQINALNEKTKLPQEMLNSNIKSIAVYQIKLEAQQKKLEILQNSGCPSPDNATCKFLIDAMNAKKQIPIIENMIQVIQKEMEKIESELCPITDAITDYEAEQYKLDYNSERHASIKRKTESLRLQAEQYTSLSGKEELLQNLTDQQQGLSDRIKTNLNQQETINNQIAELNYFLGMLSALKEEVKALEPCEKQLAELPQIKANVESALEQLKKLDDEIKTKDQLIGNLKSDIDRLLDCITVPEEGFGQTIQSAKHAEQMQQMDIKNLQTSLNTLFARQGALQSQVDNLYLDQQKHAGLSQQIAPLAKELVRWETLVKAFSKNGIPVLILENALPELERIANDILSQMTAGANSLQFITQRDAKSKDSLIETLDILISDWAGTRPFESYSGGEQTRISLAIRFGLSELLAKRSGSKIEFIVADEVLSDQSPEFRDMTVESIKALSGRFKKILLISHIPEIQTAFDQRIILSEGGKVDIQFN